MFGRFAPTPSSDLHIGNLRTALVAWLAARSTGRGFLIRVEDLDGYRMKDADQIMDRQLDDLARLGLDHDGPILRQQGRMAVYEQALAGLEGVYECFCSRKDVAEATKAPHGTTPRYPGTCRNLNESEKAELRKIRPPALRVSALAARVSVTDLVHGQYTGEVDDFVIRRADGVFAYNFAVVVDDGLQGIDQVVRGEDLLESAPRQAWLAKQLGFQVPEYVHLPLVYGSDGTRMAKRDQAISLARLHALGIEVDQVLHHLAMSLSLVHPGEQVELTTLVERFDPARLPRDPWLVDPLSWVT